MEKGKLLGAVHIPNDEASVRLDASEPGNPRLLINVPANKQFIEITETDPPFVVVIAQAKNVIATKGCLAHAADMYALAEAKLNARAALSAGVSAALNTDLTKVPPKGGKPS